MKLTLSTLAGIHEGIKNLEEILGHDKTYTEVKKVIAAMDQDEILQLAAIYRSLSDHNKVLGLSEVSIPLRLQQDIEER